MPRLTLKPGERYEIGEIVECKQQKLAFVRTKIVAVKPNKMYDIKYDTGEELRFVLESALRMVPHKRRYAYRVEMAMAVITTFTPFGLTLAFISDAGFVFLPLLLASVALLILRLGAFCQYFYNFYNSGAITMVIFFLLYGLPVLLLTVAAAIGLSSTSADPTAWNTVANMFIAAKMFSLPVLYIMRPAFCVIGVAVFIPSSAGMSLLASHFVDPTATPILYPVVPLALTVLIVKYLRKHLHAVWDVCLVIRPCPPVSELNPSIVTTVKDYILYDLLNF